MLIELFGTRRNGLKNKVLILGSTGLIGHQVFNYLHSSAQYDLYDIVYRKKLRDRSIIVDARDEEKLIKIIKDISPDFIVNCIGVLINAARDNLENAIFLNSYIPHRLAILADNLDAKLIHISTDCVFSGDKESVYFENDDKDGSSNYSKTKGLGEIINQKHLTLRTSVVGPELKNDGEELFHWFMKQTGIISGYTKSIWSGVTTIELAKAVDCAIRRDISGLYHVTNNSRINKYDLLKLFQKHTRKDVIISPVDGIETNKRFIDTRELLDYQIPSYDTMISEMVDLMRDNKFLYSQYALS
jgi:dTDP-4-dehydrorhamnose reductase